MRGKKIQKAALISCIFLFIAWISLFDQTLQLRYKNFTLIFLFVFFFVSLLYSGRFRFSRTDLALLLYLVAVTLTIPFSENKTFALEWYNIYILPIPLIYFTGRNLPRDLILPIARSIFVYSSIVVFFGILEAVSRRNIIYELWIENPYYYRFNEAGRRGIMSTLMHPTIFGSFVLGSLPFCLFFDSRAKKYYKLILKLIIVAFVFAIVFSFSRGNIVGLTGLSLIYLFLTDRRRYIKFIFVGLIILIALSTLLREEEFYFCRFSLQGLLSPWWHSESERIQITLKILKESPLLGIGLNHFRLKFDNYSSPQYKQSEEVLEKYGYDISLSKVPDNMSLCILAETGLLGFLTFILFLFSLFKKGLNRLKIIKDKTEKKFLLACLCGLVGLLIGMNTYDLLYWINPLMLFWFLAGLL